MKQHIPSRHSLALAGVPSGILAGALRPVLLGAAALLVLAAIACREATATAVDPAVVQESADADGVPPERLEGFVPAQEYTLVLADQAVREAELLFSQRHASFLVLSDRLPAAVLLDARSGSVERIDPASLERRADGSAALPGAGRLGRISKLVPGQGEVAFSVDGTVARLRYTPPPSLVGEHAIQALFEHSPAYLDQASAYQPDRAVLGELLAELEKVEQPVEVRVVFGSWCGVCKSVLPHGLRVEQELEGAPISFVYFGLPDQDPWHHPEVKRLDVKELPTAIVYRGGREVGRFAGADGFRHPEASLRDALGRGSR